MKTRGLRILTVVALVAATPVPLAPAQSAAAGSDPIATTKIQVREAAEVALEIAARCVGCSWAGAGREGAVLRLSVDGRYSQHVMVSRGDEQAVYPVLLGPLAAGEHDVTISIDRGAARQLRSAVTATVAAKDILFAGSPQFTARAHSPFLYARPGTVSRFSDIPLVMWYSTEPSARGQWIRYSVIFSNEDGGTPADKLMARWGRLTDIEYVYGVELDGSGRILAEEIQGPEHRFVPFAGAKIGRHPVMYDVTDNNMVSDRGVATELFALEPVAVQIRDASRETVMDANPWTYRISSQEALREGRVNPSATPGSGSIPDPRRFVFVEACARLGSATISYDAGFGDEKGPLTWAPADGGLADFRIDLEGSRLQIERPDGCFQSAAAAPAGAGALRALRWHAHSGRAAADGVRAPERARITRINRVFRLDADYEPGPNLLTSKDGIELAVNGAASRIDIPRR